MAPSKTRKKVVFDVEKLKTKDPQEIARIAEAYARKELTSKQVGLISIHAKDALNVIQAIAKEISKSQENAFKANAFANANAFTYAAGARERGKTSEEKRDSDRSAENLHRESTAANERMNSDNNSLWKTVVLGVVALAAIGAYARTKPTDST